MKPFLITGLPRSRTAWMAALLTAHGYPCLHEPHLSLQKWKDLNDLWVLGYCGISDPSAYIHYPEQIKKRFEGDSILWINRDSDDCKRAFENWLGKDLGDWKKVNEIANEFKTRFSPLEIDYVSLDDYETVSQMVHRLTGKPLDYKLFNIFDLLKIEQSLSKAKERARAFNFSAT